MKPRTFHSVESRSRHRRQLANAANIGKAAVEVDQLSEDMLYL